MIKILIVDDHVVVREGVKGIFDEQPGEAAFGEASTAQEALKLVREEKWDAVVLDISLGGRSGLDVLKELKQIRPRLPVLILTMHSEEQYVRRAFRAGAAGYITKDSPRTELTKAINKVIEGGRYVSPTLAEKLVLDIERGTDGPPHEALSNREFEVMRLIASGKTVSEIAELLSLSDKTISTYRTRVLEKMGMKTKHGIDAVLALAGGEALERCLDTVRHGGRCAYPNGVEPEPAKRDGLEIIPYDAVAGVREFQRLGRAVEAAKPEVPIAAAFPLAEAAKAHERLAAGHVLGKIVLWI
jgi:two-component system, NarL family, invasion response regulator UvrY